MAGLRRAHDCRRRDTLIAALARRVPTARPAGVAAGLSLLLWLPASVDERVVVARAAERSIGLLPLESLWHDPAGKPPGLLIGYAGPPRYRFSGAVAALADLLVEVVSSGGCWSVAQC
jgi:GntR family transcriptional regulator/MocR family aminotransferase